MKSAAEWEENWGFLRGMGSGGHGPDSRLQFHRSCGGARVVANAWLDTHPPVLVTEQIGLLQPDKQKSESVQLRIRRVDHVLCIFVYGFAPHVYCT